MRLLILALAPLLLSAQSSSVIVVRRALVAVASFPAATSKWLMDEGTGTTAGDSNASNDCTLSASAPTWTTPGLDFSGTDQFLDCQAIFSIDHGTTSYSFSLIAKSDTFTGVPTLLAKAERFGPFRGYSLRVRGNSPLEIEYEVHDTNTLRVENTTDPVAITQWHSYILTYDGSQTAAGATLYIDGVSVTLATLVDTLTNDGITPADFFIGCTDNSGSGALCWNGEIGTARFWSGTELNSAQAAAVCSDDESIMSGRSVTTEGCP